jgi:predicted ribosome quality control (RQC) complex YloA/Tae2 family protein
LNKATAAVLEIPAETLTAVKFKVIQINVNREGIQAEKELYMKNIKEKVEEEIEKMADSILAAEAAEEKQKIEAEKIKQEAAEIVKNETSKKTELYSLLKKAEKTQGFYAENGKPVKFSGFSVQIGNFGTLEAAAERAEECENKLNSKLNFTFQSYKNQGKMRFKVFTDSKKSKNECLPMLKKITSAGFKDAFIKKLP